MTANEARIKEIKEHLKHLSPEEIIEAFDGHFKNEKKIHKINDAMIELMPQFVTITLFIRDWWPGLEGGIHWSEDMDKHEVKIATDKILNNFKEIEI